MPDIDSLNINISANATSASESLLRLSTALESVKTSLTGLNSRNLTSLANKSGNIQATTNALAGLSSTLSNVASASGNSSVLRDISKSVATFGYKNIDSAIANMPRLTTELRNMINVLAEAKKVDANTISTLQAIANVMNSIRLPSGGQDLSFFENLTVRLTQLTTNKIGQGLTNLGNRIASLIGISRNAKLSITELASAFGLLYASLFWIKRIGSLLAGVTESFGDYIEAFNFWDVAITNSVNQDTEKKWQEAGYDNAQAYSVGLEKGLEELNEKMTGFSVDVVDGTGDIATAMVNNLGISITALTQFEARIVAVTSSAGIASDTATTMSKALAMLSGDIASLYNVDVETAMTSLSSGLIGQSRALYKYGIDITNATLQQVAFEHGVTKSVSSMSQMEKMQLRMLAILNNSKVSWGDLANTINNYNNQVRILKNGVKNLANTIGRILMPIVAKVLPYINAMVRLLQECAIWMAKLFGIKISGDSAIEAIDDEVGGLEDTMDDASESAKKLNSQLLGLDELNVLNDTSSSGGSGGGGGVIDLGDDIADAFAEYEAVWNKAYASIKDKAQKIVDGIKDAFKNGGFQGVGQYVADGIKNALQKINWDKIFEVFRNFGANLARFLNGLFSPDTFKEIGKTIANCLNAVLYLKGEFLDKINAVRIGEAIAEAINGFFETYDFAQAGHNFATFASKLFTGLYTAVKKIKWANIFKGLFDFVKELNIPSLVLVFGSIAFKLGGALLSSQIVKTALGTQLGGLLSSGILTSNISKLNASLGNFGLSIGKLVAGVGSLATEFALVYSAVKKITLGLGDFNKNITTIVGSITAVGIITTSVFGFPAGVIMTAVTAVSAGLLGVKKGFDEITESIEKTSIVKALSENEEGMTIYEVTEAYKNYFSEMTSGFDTISEKAEEIQTSKESIDITTRSIGELSSAIANGAYTAEEKIPELEQLFQGLREETESVFEQEYDLIVLGISGALSDSLEVAGYTVPQIIEILSGFKSDYQTKLEEITSAQEGLQQQYEDGVISAEEYTTKMSEFSAQLAELAGSSDELTVAVENMNTEVDKIDFSGLVNADGTLNTDALVEQIGNVTSSARESKDVISGSADSFSSAIQDLQQKAESIGDTDALSALSAALDAENQNVESASEGIDQAIRDYGDKVQTGLLEELPEVIDNALADYENQSFLYKMTHSEADCVEGAVQEYKDTVLAPAEESLQQMYNDLGVDGSVWATDSANSIVKSLFTINYTDVEGMQMETSTTLNTAWKTILDDAMAELDAKTYGKDVVTGFNNGITENSSTTGTVIQNYAKNADKKFHDSIFKFGSPSQRMHDYGQWTVEGFNNGFSANADTTLPLLTDWAEKCMEILNQFHEDVQSLFDKSNWTFDGLRDGLVDSMNNAINSVRVLWNDFVTMLNALLYWTVPPLIVEGKTLFAGCTIDLGNLPLLDITAYKTGGFLEDGLFTMSDDEIVGKFANGKSAVANNEQIIRGIASGVASANQEQNILLTEQNTLLRKLLEKDTSINIGDKEIARASVRGQRQLGLNLRTT